MRSATNTLSTMPHVLEPQVDYDKLATVILKQSNHRSSSVLPQPTTSTTLLPSEEPSNSATTVQSSLSQPTTSAGAKDNFPQQDPEVELAFHSQPVSSTSGLGSLIEQIFLDEPAKSRENHATDLLDEGIPLVASVLQKLKAKIWSNEFTDLRTVLTFKEDSLSVTISSRVINLNQESKFKTPISIGQWTDAFLVFSAIYLEKYPNDAPCV